MTTLTPHQSESLQNLLAAFAPDCPERESLRMAMVRVSRHSMRERSQYIEEQHDDPDQLQMLDDLDVLTRCAVRVLHPEDAPDAGQGEWQPTHPASVDASAARDRLRAFICDVRPGGCKLLSQGRDCNCPLCDVDRLFIREADLQRTERELDEACAEPIPDEQIDVIVGRVLAVDAMKDKDQTIAALKVSLAERADTIAQEREQVAVYHKAACDYSEEIRQLRGAIRRAGFGVMQTSGDWTIHDISEAGKREEERTADIIAKNIELEAELERLKGENEQRKHRAERHIHVSRDDGTDTCLLCCRDIRDGVHLRKGEDDELQKLRAAKESLEEQLSEVVGEEQGTIDIPLMRCTPDLPQRWDQRERQICKLIHDMEKLECKVRASDEAERIALQECAAKDSEIVRLREGIAAFVERLGNPRKWQGESTFVRRQIAEELALLIPPDAVQPGEVEAGTSGPTEDDIACNCIPEYGHHHPWCPQAPMKAPAPEPAALDLSVLCECGHVRRSHEISDYSGPCVCCDCEAFEPRDKPEPLDLSRETLVPGVTRARTRDGEAVLFECADGDELFEWGNSTLSIRTTRDGRFYYAGREDGDGDSGYDIIAILPGERRADT